MFSAALGIAGVMSASTGNQGLKSVKVLKMQNRLSVLVPDVLEVLLTILMEQVQQCNIVISLIVIRYNRI